MIAIAENRCRTSKAKPSAPTFEELLAGIECQARIAFRGLPASEREELLAEVVANAFCAYRRLVERGLNDVIYSTPLAKYAVKQVRSGRRVGGRLNIRDASSVYCQRSKGIVVERLDRRDAKSGTWLEVVVEDKTAGPADIAAIRIDFSEWLKSLGAKRRRIANTLATGESTSGAAVKFGLSCGRVSQLRRELMASWEEFHQQNKREILRPTRPVRPQSTMCCSDAKDAADDPMPADSIGEQSLVGELSAVNRSLATVGESL